MATILCPALEEITLADGILSRKKFLNGCNFRIQSIGGKKSIGPGCYLLVNLIQGAEYYLWRWIKENRDEEGFAPLPDEPEIHQAIVKIMGERPCSCCGGDIFKILEEE